MQPMHCLAKLTPAHALHTLVHTLPTLLEAAGLAEPLLENTLIALACHVCFTRHPLNPPFLGVVCPPL
jgi:hypothetical protein